MTNLSPAALAVLEAAEKQTDLDFRYAPQIAAAALRAAADQVAPSDLDEPRNYLPMAMECQRIRKELLAIADELDPTTDDQPMNELTLKQKELLQLYQQAVADFQSAFDAYLQSEKILDKRRSDCRNAGFNPRD